MRVNIRLGKLTQLTMLFVCVVFLVLSPTQAKGQEEPTVIPMADSPDLVLNSAAVRYLPDMDVLVFEQQVNGAMGGTLPSQAGQLDGAPVLGYVFPTTLQSEDVGFNPTEGVVALAVTSHPDFDDTPLWDENTDGQYDNDGLVLHTHWVVLAPDERTPGGLAVKQFDEADTSVVLPPTNPGMPMYMDSPGFAVVTQQDTLKVFVPAQRLSGKTDFRYDAVAAYMEVNTSDDNRPLLGVYKAYSVLSGDLSLPYSVTQ